MDAEKKADKGEVLPLLIKRTSAFTWQAYRLQNSVHGLETTKRGVKIKLK